MGRSILTMAIALSVVCLLTASAAATPPVGPNQVPGKEYSNHPDEDWQGNLDPLQNIWWDGNGNAADTFDFTGSAAFGSNDNVDAMANHSDFLYWEVTHDQVHMLLSFAHTPTQPPTDGQIYYQEPGVDVSGVWATRPIINSTALPDDVDGLEVWGPADTDDADMFSLIADPYGVAVYRYYSGPHTSVPYLTTAQLQAAIETQELIDLDAMMLQDEDDDDLFGPGDSIMFSIHETMSVGGIYDGGEIWVWNFGAPAQFLLHGGETWNTAHTVGLDFGVLTEEINALEAVPEPATLGLLMFGGLALLRRRRA